MVFSVDSQISSEKKSLSKLILGGECEEVTRQAAEGAGEGAGGRCERVIR